MRSTPMLAGAVICGGLVLAAATMLWPTVGAVLLALAWVSVGLALVAVLRRVRALTRDARQQRTSMVKAIENAIQAESVVPVTAATRAGSAAGQHDPGVWTREATLGGRYTPRPLSDFVAPTEPVAWTDENPFLHRPRDETLAAVLAGERWRHHHGIPELATSPELYAAYALRVDAMLEMLDAALAMTDIDVSRASFLDLGAAEGYVTHHLLDRGATDVDAVELGEANIQRMWMVRALKEQKGGRIGRIDFDGADWSTALGRTYDVTLALGVIYHMENPMLFARNLFAATDRVSIVESDTPVFAGNQRFRGFGTMYLHRDQVTLSPGDVRYLTEMRPDRQALAEILLSAGFSRVHAIAPATTAPSRFFDSGEKTVLLAVR